MRLLLFVFACQGCVHTLGGHKGDNAHDNAKPGDCEIFPEDNPWNTEVRDLPVHPKSDAYLRSMGLQTTLHPDFGTVWEGAPIGIPTFNIAEGQQSFEVEFQYGSESDPGPYPLPLDAPIEGGDRSDGDRHVIGLDTSTCMLYELYDAHPKDNSWKAGSGAIFDLSSNALRPDGWTSADAAGLPIYPGLVRYDEVVEQGAVLHAVRFTVAETQKGYIHPATHHASDDTDPSLPPMGLRIRMKADYDCSGMSSEVQVLCTAFKTYGLLLADNGSDWYISGSPDPRWDEDAIHELGDIPGSAFEAVQTGDILR